MGMGRGMSPGANSPASAESQSIAERLSRMGGGRSEGANPGPPPCFAPDEGSGLRKTGGLEALTNFNLILPLNRAVYGGCATARMNW